MASRELAKLNAVADKATRMSLYSDAIAANEAMLLQIADTRTLLRDAIRKVCEC